MSDEHDETTRRMPDGRPATVSPDYGPWLARVLRVAPEPPFVGFIGNPESLATLNQDAALQRFLRANGLGLAALTQYERERLGRGVLVIDVGERTGRVNYMPEYWIADEGAPTAARADDLRRLLTTPDRDDDDPSPVALINGEPVVVVLAPGPKMAAKVLEDAGIPRPT